MSGKTAVVIGSTGMIGELLVQYLIRDPAYSMIRLLVRKPVRITDPKIEVAMTDFNNPDDYAQKIGTGDVIFSCVGTTQSSVKGDLSAYRKIDFDIPVNAARHGLKAGFKKLLIVSSVGADSKAGNFYLKLKGETEDALKAIGLEALHIYQPSLLMGKRKENRLMEKVAQAVMPVLSIFLLGNLKKYKPVSGEKVAQRMVLDGKSDVKGVFVHQYADLNQSQVRFL
ncbi:MAG: NAD-dependent epimerase/dehydratase family protein [Chitinophagaceae bacterium]|nr:MAG: NAD-dependent epimerase/dehydratase family protein [Chitinophagaceae bacterium]